MTNTAIVIMAKECVPGAVKTRLTPPFTPAQAAQIAQAALDDTLNAVADIGDRRVICLRGTLPPREGFEQIPQVDGDLDDRIGAVLDAVPERVLLVGMDTPQLDPALLARLTAWPDDVDAWFGPAEDGGFWLLGIRSLAELASGRPAGWRRGDLVRGVPMSRDDTGAVQRQRLIDAGLRVADVGALVDIDDVDDLRHVAASLPPESTLAHLLLDVPGGLMHTETTRGADR